MKVLITGVCGFVGSSLAQALVERAEGIQIAGMDNLMRPGAESNRPRMEALGVDFRHGDLRNPSDLAGFPRCDWVIDAAANPSVIAGLSGAAAARCLYEHNLSAHGNVLEYCREHGAGLIVLSTSRVFSIAALASIPLRVEDDAFTLDVSVPLPAGLSGDGIARDFSTAPPVSLYGATKLACECTALEWGAAFDFPVWVNRCGVLAGAGQFGTAAQGILAYWLNAHLRRRPLRYIGFEGSGHQVRDAFHPRDLAELLLAQMRTQRAGGNRIYTLGGGPANSFSLAQLTAWCDNRFGPHPVHADLAPRTFDIPWMVMDSRAAQRDLGWHIQTPLAAILEEIAGHALLHPEWLPLSGV